jgi:methylated-DNA-[protein]-cysteine S-methyltransferase
LIADGDILLRVSLTLASSFSVTFQNTSPALEKTLTTWITNYLKKKETPFLTIPTGTSFQETIWKQLTLIPFGSTLSYGQLADLIGNPKAQRAVGGACNKNPYPLLLPCHRVIQAGNKLGGFAFDLEVKKKLLEFESEGSPAQTE